MATADGMTPADPSRDRPSLPPALRRGAALGAAWALCVSAVAACSDEPTLRRLPEPETQVDELKQKPAAQVDILWVVDNSQSMVEEQASLAQNFGKFINGLTVCAGGQGPEDTCNFEQKKCRLSGAPCNPPDYHIGVVSTDVIATSDQGRLRRVGLCVPSAGSMPANGKYRYCQSDNRQCAPDASDPESDPANATCDMGQAIAYVTATTPGAASAFSRAVRVGVGGSGLEQGIRAAAMALGRDTNRTTGAFIPAPAENDGFLRKDASLFVVFVTDEDDSSFGQVSYFYRAFESLKGAGNEGLVSLSAIVGDPDLDGPAGTQNGGCPVDASDALRTAVAGSRYIQLAMYSRGLSAEFRVCDDKRLKCAATESCQTPVPGYPGICVPTAMCTTDQSCGNFKCGDRGCVTCESGQCRAQQSGFDALLTRNGVYQSICSTNYEEVLSALGYEAAGLRRKFEISKLPDCTKTIDCGGQQAAICVKVGDQVVANSRASGWIYEQGANAVFFDGSFVPPTGATVTVSYKATDTPAAIACETLATAP